jgi:multiple sugar transport system ATP-binding protein
MGRAIVRDPQVFLMDEPLSNLDAKLRVQMRAEVSRIQHEFGTTTVYVTHDQVEAMTMGDRVAVMRRGRLQQMEAPQRLYDEPANLFVATFIGSPAMNVLEGELAAAADGRLSVSLGEDRLDIPDTTLDTHPALRSYVGRKIAVGIRPEQLREAGDEPMLGRSIRGVVKVVEALGSELLVHVDVSAGPILVDEVVEASTVDAADASLMATLMTAADKIHAGVVGRLQPNAPVSVGDSIVLAVDVGKLHFFDLETGLAIHG